ncbi:hypothetical protein GCM10009424_08940 [Sphingomonas ursincola]
MRGVEDWRTRPEVAHKRIRGDYALCFPADGKLRIAVTQRGSGDARISRIILTAA